MAWSTTTKYSASEEMVKSALKDKWVFEISCEGDFILLGSNDFDEIMEHLHSVEVADVHLQKEGEKDDWCCIILHNGEPDCEISDCIVGGYVDQWCERTDYGQRRTK